MGKYLINGGNFEVADSIQGEELNTTLTQLASMTAQQNTKKFLAFLGKAEGADYDTIVGGRQKISDFTSHPNVVGLRTAEGPSTAAGKYQITGTTYRTMAPSAGVTDFSPESQDKVALALISQKGAMEHVEAGDFNKAISKLGGVWASLPSSKYTQSKRSQQWVDQALAQAPTAPPEATSPLQPNGFQPWGTVVKNADPASFSTNPEFLSASAQFYNMRERKRFTGDDNDLADYGKGVMGRFNNNVVDMADYASDLARSGKPEDIRAFLYMMDQYDETQMSWEGTGRAALAMGTDPVNLVGIGTFGTAAVAKVAASIAAKQAIRKSLMTSLGRTGIQAGIVGGGQAAVVNTIKQGVEVRGGKKDSMSASELALKTAEGAVAGVVLGTAADALLTAAAPAVKNVIGKIADTVGIRTPAAKDAAKATTKTAGPTDAPPLGIFKGAEKDVPVGTAGTTLATAPEDVTTPNVTGTPNKAPVSTSLPSDLAGAKPRWKTSDVAFESDIDKALFITSQTKKSKRDGDYRDWLKSHGMTDTEIDEAGAAVRAALKQKGAVTPEGEVLDLKATTKLKEAPTGEPLDSVGKAADDAPAATPDASGTLPISTTLTEQEMIAAGTRSQKGRLWTDDIPHDLPLNAGPVSNLVIPASAPALRATERNMAQLTTDGMEVAAQLRHLDDSTLKQSLEVLRSSTSLQDAPTIFRAVQILHDEGRVSLAELIKKMQKATPEEMPALLAQKAALEDRLINIQLADDAMGSFGGSLNRQRQEGLMGLQGSTVESIMTEKGVSRAEAEVLWVNVVDSAEGSTVAKRLSAVYETKISEALDAGKIEEVAKLIVMKNRELSALAEEAAPKGAAWRERLHTFAGGLKELMISNLFSIKTLLINAFPAGLKTLSIPFLKFLVTNPLEKAAQVEMAAHYSAMGATVRGAFTAAHAAYKYEQSILTRDASRLLEGEMVMTGKLGGALRFFPRILNATDEFLAQINYAGFVSGKAAHTAAIDGTAKGLTGKALKDFIEEAVTKAKSTMFDAADEALVQPIINKGNNLGLTGDDLIRYVETEALKNPEVLRHGADKEALDFVRDVLYKRKFSGEGAASSGAQSIETMFRQNPSFSLLIGQLFFRTPIRVFEEGIRLTPGVQLLAPGFIKDLTGANGQLRQVRANAEALTGLAITGTALSLYAAGSITGSGSYNNWKQDKNRKDGPAPEPYTIRFSDGSTWSFKNMDPLSTPLKILVNAFEGMDKLRMREAQGDFIGQPEYKLIMARIFVGTAAVTTAISDANLVSGLKGTVDLLSQLSDPGGKEDAIIKKVGSELSALVPNTLHKIIQANDPRLRDPATFFQMLETKFGNNTFEVGDVRTSFAYDPLGQVRQPADTGSMWNIFSTASQEERIRGHSEAHGIVMGALDQIAKETGTVFAPPSPKNPLTGNLDLRTMMTQDGQETLYDRWQRNYRDQEPESRLVGIAQSSMPIGTAQFKGEKVSAIQGQMKFMQATAFTQLLTEEKVRERMIKQEVVKAKTQAGLFDVNNRDK